ncbi:MAG: type II toxin-antitoxin system PemK/MazF family toxin [Candidatus Vogelbacteria bacterium]
MEKDFDQWNERKKGLHDRDRVPFYHEREIWWCALGVNIGSEQDGSGEESRRPVLILKGLSTETCLIVPLTTSSRKHFLRPSVGTVGGKKAYALLSQLRVVDTKRLISKVGYLEKNMFEIIRKAVKTML